jgi:outer membrane receptor protein involved in Fe transport
MKSSLLLCTLPLAALAAPAWAQDECDKECQDTLDYERDQAHYGTRLPDRMVFEEPIPITAITANDIIVTGALKDAQSEAAFPFEPLSIGSRFSDRVEALAGSSGSLQQFRRSDARSANPTSQGITLRGLGGNASSRALLFVDDVPQADPFGGWVSWPGYDALNLARARLQKGGGSPSAGPGALAGVIELDSLQSTASGALNVSYGSRNSVEARGRYAAKSGGGSFAAGVSYARSDGFTPIVASQRGLADRRAAYEQAGIALRGVAPLSASTELQANLRAFTDARNRGLDFSDNENGGVDASLRLVKRSGDWQWSATGYLQLREFSSEFGAVSADRSIVTPTLDQFATPSTGLGVRFEVRPPVGEKAELRLGGEWRRTDGETKERFTFVAGTPTRLRTAGGQTDSYGGFAELTLKPDDALTLSAGGRLDRWQIAQGFRREVNIGGTVRSDDRFADRSGSEWTGRGGFGWQLADDWTLRGAAYRGWRLPTLNELYRPFRVGADATAANQALRPEVVKGVEAGIGFDDDSNRVRATLFWNRLNDAIANVTLGQGPGNFPGVGFVAAGGTYRQRQNLDAIVSKGIEIDGEFRLVHALWLQLGYAYLDAKVRGNGFAALLDGLRPAQVPRHFANVSLDYMGDDFSAAVALRYLGRQFDDDANSRALADALTVDLMAAYGLSTKLRVELRGENLFNERVEAAISGNGIIERASPRTLWLGVRWNFD